MQQRMIIAATILQPKVFDLFLIFDDALGSQADSNQHLLKHLPLLHVCLVIELANDSQARLVRFAHSLRREKQSIALCHYLKRLACVALLVEGKPFAIAFEL